MGKSRPDNLNRHSHGEGSLSGDDLPQPLAENPTHQPPPTVP